MLFRSAEYGDPDQSDDWAALSRYSPYQNVRADTHLAPVLFTTSTRDEDVARSYDGGACSFVSKPVNLEKLKEVIKQFALYWSLVSVVPQPRPAESG